MKISFLSWTGRAPIDLADLYEADLYGADLHEANLYGADLHGANLRGADLYGADLHGANLRGADLRGANLYGADLHGANLRGADLRGADLYEANLRGAKNIPTLTAAQTLIVPQDGTFVGWKKCKNNVIVSVLIPVNARRSNATGRKCRAEFVEVLKVYGAEEGISQHDGKTSYVKGKTVHCDNWCKDRWEECAGGIHFFLTREEAEAY